MMGRPDPSEHGPSYSAYIDLVAEDDVVPVVEAQRHELTRLPELAGTARETYRYAPGKWTVREVVGHLGDAERIFGYRLLCVSRGETQSLPGFDENVYADRGTASRRPLLDLLGELLALRDANLALLRNLDDASWARQGVANGTPITTRALAYVLAGHTRHHLGILRDRYGLEGVRP
jgi:hypothetical protein